MKEKKYTILGIDPGIGITGWSIIEHIVAGRSNKVIDYGVIRTKPNTRVDERLVILYNELDEIIKKYNPQIASIEK